MAGGFVAVCLLVADVAEFTLQGGEAIAVLGRGLLRGIPIEFPAQAIALTGELAYQTEILGHCRGLVTFVDLGQAPKEVIPGHLPPFPWRL